jgi:hypothetical protein
VILLEGNQEYQRLSLRFTIISVLLLMIGASFLHPETYLKVYQSIDQNSYISGFARYLPKTSLVCIRESLPIEADTSIWTNSIPGYSVNLKLAQDINESKKEISTDVILEVSGFGPHEVIDYGWVGAFDDKKQQADISSKNNSTQVTFKIPATIYYPLGKSNLVIKPKLIGVAYYNLEEL